MTVQQIAYADFQQSHTCSSARSALLTYMGALEARDAECISALTADDVLIEHPLLKPNRLFGSREIAQGHQAAFRSIEEITFSISGEVVEKDEAAIGMGSITYSRLGENEIQRDVGVVVQLSGTRLRRISVYLDSRNLRRWSDESIL